MAALVQDRRRVQGPPESFQPLVEASEKSEKPLVGANGIRADGRKLDDFRPVCMCSRFVLFLNKQTKKKKKLETKPTKKVTRRPDTEREK